MIKQLILVIISALIVTNAAEGIEPPIKQWSENEFVKKIKNIDKKDFEALWKYGFTLLDGGNKHTFKPDSRNASIPLIDLERKDVEVINVEHLVVLLHKECIAKNGGVGIAELFYWHRRLRVFFISDDVPNKLQDELKKLHIAKSKKHWENRGKAPFTVLCTIAGKQKEGAGFESRKQK